MLWLLFVIVFFLIRSYYFCQNIIKNYNKNKNKRHFRSMKESGHRERQWICAKGRKNKKRYFQSWCWNKKKGKANYFSWQAMMNRNRIILHICKHKNIDMKMFIVVSHCMMEINIWCFGWWDVFSFFKHDKYTQGNFRNNWPIQRWPITHLFTNQHFFFSVPSMTTFHDDDDDDDEWTLVES